MASMISSTLRRAASQPKPPVFRASQQDRARQLRRVAKGTAATRAGTATTKRERRGTSKNNPKSMSASEGVLKNPGKRFTLQAATMNLKRGLAGEAPTGGKTFKQSWLSDKGAWPVMGVIGFAVSFVTYWSFSTLATHPDVRINRTQRGSVIRPKSGENAEQEA